MYMYKNTHHLVYYLYQIAFINFRDIFYSSFYAMCIHCILLGFFPSISEERKMKTCTVTYNTFVSVYTVFRVRVYACVLFLRFFPN